MKWSVKDEYGTMFLTEGMWQAMHPSFGLIGHTLGAGAWDERLRSD
jgi:hypothetical protein